MFVSGKVEKVEMVMDEQTGQFGGNANVDFESENDAKQAFNKMMGLQVKNKYLYVKKCLPPTEDELIKEIGGENIADHEIFKQIIEDKATKCLVLKNVVELAENHEPEDFKELEFDVGDEMVRYGQVVRTHVPRPPKYGDPYLSKGFGKVYVRFSNEKEAENAKNGLYKRRFNDRTVEISFYDEEKFINNVFE